MVVVLGLRPVTRVSAHIRSHTLARTPTARTTPPSFWNWLFRGARYRSLVARLTAHYSLRSCYFSGDSSCNSEILPSEPTSQPVRLNYPQHKFHGRKSPHLASRMEIRFSCGKKEIKQGARRRVVMEKNSQGAKFARFLSICGTFGAKVVQVLHPPDLNALNRLISIRLFRLWVVGVSF